MCVHICLCSSVAWPRTWCVHPKRKGEISQRKQHINQLPATINFHNSASQLAVCPSRLDFTRRDGCAACMFVVNSHMHSLIAWHSVDRLFAFCLYSTQTRSRRTCVYVFASIIAVINIFSLLLSLCSQYFFYRETGSMHSLPFVSACFLHHTWFFLSFIHFDSHWHWLFVNTVSTWEMRQFHFI